MGDESTLKIHSPCWATLLSLSSARACSLVVPVSDDRIYAVPFAASEDCCVRHWAIRVLTPHCCVILSSYATRASMARIRNVLYKAVEYYCHINLANIGKKINWSS